MGASTCLSTTSPRATRISRFTNPTSNAWTAGPTAPPDTVTTGLVLSDGHLLIVADNSYLSEYDPSASQWVASPQVPSPIDISENYDGYGAVVGMLAHGRILSMGGSGGDRLELCVPVRPHRGQVGRVTVNRLRAFFAGIDGCSEADLIEGDKLLSAM